MTVDDDGFDFIPINQEVARTLPKFYQELRAVVKFYEFEPVDHSTMQHINAYVQSRAPGPYRVFFDKNNMVDVKFEFASEQDRSWWYLKWS